MNRRKYNVPQLFGEWKLREFADCPQNEERLQMVFVRIKLEENYEFEKNQNVKKEIK